MVMGASAGPRRQHVEDGERSSEAELHVDDEALGGAVLGVQQLDDAGRQARRRFRRAERGEDAGRHAGEPRRERLHGGLPCLRP